MRSHSDRKSSTILSPTEARQGEVSGRVRTILATSLLLTLLAGVAFLIYYGS